MLHYGQMTVVTKGRAELQRPGYDLHRDVCCELYYPTKPTPPNSTRELINQKLLLASYCTKSFWDVKLNKTFFIISALEELYTFISFWERLRE